MNARMWPTPRPWPPEVEPTPDQLAEWMQAATDDERTAFAAQALDAIRTAQHCRIAHP